MRKLNIPETATKLTEFIKSTITSTGFTDVIVAVSGGVDSATSLSLAAQALGPNHVHALLLPYQNWHDEHKTHAQKLLTNLKIPQDHIHEVDIAPIIKAFIPPLNLRGGQGELIQTRLGNVMARTRMIVLYDFAKKLNTLVLGTENLSEHYLGYFTRFGDEASDIEPLRSLYKTEIYALAKHLNVPEEIINKAPTAALWPGQTDEGQFGFTYAQADEVLYQLFDLKKPVAEISKSGIPSEVVMKVEQWVKSVDFKHHLPHLAPEPIKFDRMK